MSYASKPPKVPNKRNSYSTLQVGRFTIVNLSCIRPLKKSSLPPHAYFSKKPECNIPVNRDFNDLFDYFINQDFDDLYS
uniref:Uncharacterized protein n=1 Tax=viral metagenome TaxID=1070528 RepID=A0A6C0KD66_9ZZZZ